MVGIKCLRLTVAKPASLNLIVRSNLACASTAATISVSSHQGAL
jgi:hypothetical protein